jgi:4'-phosphopantetheinyl transferase
MQAMQHADPAQLRWRETADAPELAEHGLHLWRIPLEGGEGSLDPGALKILSQRQRERYRRLRGEHLQQRYLRAQVGCRLILAAYLDMAPADIALRYGAAGKPELAQPGTRLHFNLTTTGDLALLALSDGLPVGVDCELERPRADLHGIARRMFDAEAVRTLNNASPEAAARLFYLHWTALEARVKADGRGLSRRRDADPAGLAVGHALAGYANGARAICAVARSRLPPESHWGAFQLTAASP